MYHDHDIFEEYRLLVYNVPQVGLTFPRVYVFSMNQISRSVMSDSLLPHISEDRMQTKFPLEGEILTILI